MTGIDRRAFVAGSAIALAGCATGVGSSACPAAGTGAGEWHVFSKMFQPPVTKSPEELCALMSGAGFDGIQWTVRPKGHVEPSAARTELPRLCRIAESFGLRNRTICTDLKPGDANAEEVLKVAADCGIVHQRPAYFFYDAKRESFRQSLDRFRRGFAWFADLAERTGVRMAYQNHSSWGPSVFGGVIWDIHECIRDLDPRLVGVEYDPMHAFFETSLSWSHGLELIAPWIAAVDLKDFHYRPDPKDARKVRKAMVPAGEGIVPWGEAHRLLAANGVKVPYIVHFEHKFDTADLPATVKREIGVFRRVFTD